MSDWTAGYVTDVGYTYGYYSELNPLRLRLAFLHAGLAPPELGTACELGFGQGMSINIHAAASPVAWHGTDFNPAQTAFARELAAISNSGAALFDDAFADFAQRPDLPEFDFIGIHGIWSWISAENRAVMVEFLRRRLRVGGVLYISYNTLPGWSPMLSMRHLMTRHAEVMAAPGTGIVGRIDAALNFTDKLLGTNPLCSRANPTVVERMKKVREHNRHYLAHEYFNRDWHPMHFGDMADALGPAKLNYACSAHYIDQVDMVNLTPDQQNLMREIPDPLFRESVRDYMVNQQFRRDYWVRGARRLSQWEIVEGVRNQRVVLVNPRAEVAYKITGSQGEVNLNDGIYSPVLDLLADHKVRTIGQVEQHLQSKGVNFPQLFQVMMILIGKGDLAPAQDERVIGKARSASDKLNVHLGNKALGSGEITFLSSPVTGGGIPINRFQQLFLLALNQGKKQPADWAAFCWQVLAGQGQKLVQEGKTLETPEENLAKLTEFAQEFAAKRLPILKALQVA